MKTFILSIAILLPCISQAQIGIKAGLNFANVTKASSINNSSQTGFHAGAFLAPPSNGILGYRSELIYSRQGYDYKSANNTGTVNLDYIMIPQLMSINITKYFSLQLGAQMAYLLNAKVDSTDGNGNESGNGIMDLYNRIDYGYAAGVEVHPVSGVLLGARINISLSRLYKNAQRGQMPSFSDVDVKNNVFQIFSGWRFGGKSKTMK